METNAQFLTEYVPPALWGKDHWSLLAYIETVIVDCGGFHVGFDPRMRQNRRNFRVMSEQCINPKRPGPPSRGIPMDPKYGTRLNNNSFIENHDDWMCVQDFINAGILEGADSSLEPGDVLYLTEQGRVLANRLREHKAAGGSFSKFLG